MKTKTDCLGIHCYHKVKDSQCQSVTKPKMAYECCRCKQLTDIGYAR